MEALDIKTALLGESPLHRGTRLAFIDMLEGTVRSVDLATAAEIVTPVAAVPVPYLGAVVESDAGGLAAVTLDGVVTVPHRLGESPRKLATIVRDPTVRLNDAAVDPSGRLWVGSTSVTGEVGRGALHRWAPGSPAEILVEGMTLPNGIGWSPDGRRAYVVDSHARTVLTATVDLDSGAIGEFDVLVEVGEPGEPDGLAVATDGTIWVAVWDGARVDRYAPDGTLVQAIQVPVSRPTACAFGRGELFVTTARHGLPEETLAAEPLAGSVLRLPVDVSGVVPGRLAV